MLIFKKLSKAQVDIIILDLDVGSGGGIFTLSPRGRVNIDIDLPKIKVPNFIRASVFYLPFRASEFHWVSAFTMLEHVSNPYAAIFEMLRVGNQLVIRQDAIYSIRNYAMFKHLQFQLGHRFLQYPRTWLGIRFSRLLFLLCSKPQLQRLINLTFRWNYYEVISSNNQ